ncbi:MAG: glycosyltransferase family A protein [bacterium]
MKLDVIMTTFDRTDLLKATVDSYCESAVTPDEIQVFDDCSANFGAVAMEIARVPGAVLHRRQKNLGCNKNTPAALQYMFEKHGSEAVLVVDSDTLFAKDWWTTALAAIEALKERDCGCVTLFTHGEAKPEKTINGVAFSICTDIGAEGAVFTKTFFNKYISPVMEQRRPWDVLATGNASKDGLKPYRVCPSKLQHIGTSVGHHVGGTAFAVAAEFEGKKSSETATQPGGGNRVLVSCMGVRYDVLVASIIVRRLAKEGYDVVVETLQQYGDIVQKIGKTKSLIIEREPDCVTSKYTDAFEMKRRHPGFSYYLNLQGCSPEHIHAVKKQQLGYFVEYCNKILGKKMAVTSEDLEFETGPRYGIVVPADEYKNREMEEIVSSLTQNKESVVVLIPPEVGPALESKIIRRVAVKTKSHYEYMRLIYTAGRSVTSRVLGIGATIAGTAPAVRKNEPPTAAGKKEEKTVVVVPGAATAPDEKPKRAGKMGIAISTYFGPGTSTGRLEIFMTSIYSLLASEFPGKIIVVDDGSTSKIHLQKIANNPRIKIIYKTENGGVAKCKNTGLKNLLDCDYLFLADDDMIYNGEWWTPYISTYAKTGFRHLLFRPTIKEFPFSRHLSEEFVEHDGFPVKRMRHVNGCLFFITRDIIDMVGGFKILPNKFGFEHINFSDRVKVAANLPFYCDAADSNEWLHLSMRSYTERSIDATGYDGIAQMEYALKDKRLRESIEE